MNEFAGLGLMDDAVGESLPQATQRVKLLTGFIAFKNLDGEFAKYATPTFNPSISFHRALTAAMNECLGRPAMSEDLDTLGREVAGETMLAQGNWDQYQAARKKRGE
ncbi:MAG: hypothetical protein SGJ09_04720 [Phycisphaerae bacterium]|mgnify:CR=1 FL=1|nr:hypothetical protein [Phycisphaerae bacterium]